MTALKKLQLSRLNFYLFFALIVIAGVYLRLDQFTLQVLIDDEWHAVHQLLQKSPSELFLSLGHADYSIPLALLYFVEMKYFGLSELSMRWPMMLAGIASLLVFPLYLRKIFGDRLVLLFTALLAISPLLIIYSRMARPYSLTLLLSLLAIAALYRFADSEYGSWKAAFLYVLTATLSAWLHLLTLPLVFAPFVTLGLMAVYQRNWRLLSRLFWLGLISGAAMLALLLPPLLAHPQALAAKLGSHSPDLQTFSGALFLWFGTTTVWVVVTGAFLAAIGFVSLWKKLHILPAILFGAGITLLVLLLLQPAWVNHSLTLARYLLVLLPLLLLATALGVLRLSAWIVAITGRPGKILLWPMWILLAGTIATTTPLLKLLAKPNSNSLHVVYQMDFRADHNPITEYQQNFPVSAFWGKLSSLPADSLKIAAAPFYFESYNWDAARWEQRSGQRVMPAYLSGICDFNRWGEVPNNASFRFKNVAYADDIDDLVQRGFDYLVFQKVFTFQTVRGPATLGEKTIECEQKLRDNLPQPNYEDEWLIAFPLSSGATVINNVKR